MDTLQRALKISRNSKLQTLRQVIAGCADADEQELFRAQMLTEMARMSLEDGLVMQLHPGSFRNYNRNSTSAMVAISAEIFQQRQITYMHYAPCSTVSAMRRTSR